MRPVTALVALGAVVLAVSAAASVWSVPLPHAGDPTPALLATVGLPVLHRPAVCSGHVALSFDDGPSSTSTDLLEVLRHYGVPATFFNTGANSRALPGVVAAERHLPGVQFGNHTWDHPHLDQQDPAQVRSQILRTRAVQGPLVTFFRPPYGEVGAVVVEQARLLGLVFVLWTQDSQDFSARSVDQVVAASAGMRDGGILLLHDAHPLTVLALPAVIASYYARGLCIGRIATSRVAQRPAESPDLPFFARAVAP